MTDNFRKNKKHRLVNRNRNRNAYSLIELSVVMIIVAIIATTILSAKNYLNNKNIYSVIGELQKYKSAAIQFRELYSFWPGDFPSASNRWSNSDCTSGLSSSGGCNGNGNGKILSSENEVGRVWQHLEYAGLIPPNGYKGNVSSGQLPQNSSGKGYYSIRYISVASASALYFNTGGHALEYGANYSSGFAGGAILSSEDAYYIDQKIDDGIPFSGDFMAVSLSANMGCPVWNSSSPTKYDLSKKTKDCWGIFWVEEEPQ